MFMTNTYDPTFFSLHRIKGEPFSSRIVEERQQDKITVTGLDLRPSRIYEFSVVSIDGGFKTESDIQEVFFFAGKLINIILFD